MKTVSLFCGCGGLDYGFKKAGFDIIWANDFDKYAVQTYKANFGDHVVLGDINQIPLDEIPQFDVLIGGFPCQPFSTMGHELGFEDTRGTLFFRIVEILKYQIDNGHPPKAVILENVKGLRTHDHGNTFRRIKEILMNDLHFKVYDTVLNTADYGIPQTRNRTYIVCFSDHNVDFHFPEKMVLHETMQDLLEQDVPDKYFLSEKILKTVLASGTKNFRGKSEIDLKIARPLCATMAKMHRACQDNYVTQKGHVRRLTPRECARLQGFDDDFIIPVSDTQAYKQFGNAVTVNVAYAVASAVKDALEKKTSKKATYPVMHESINDIPFSLQLFAEKKDDSAYDKKDVRQFKTDTQELKQLLAFLPVKKNDSALTEANITAAVADEPYLTSRGEWQKEQFATDKEMQSLLSNANCDNDDCHNCIIRKYCNRFIADSRTKVNADAPAFIDLFCGAGGLSLGFRQEGFTLSLANDIQECCIDTYTHNHPETPRKHIILGDIQKVVDDIDQLTRFKKTDLIIGGPPCQGFSIANQQRLIDDPRNHLYKSYVEAVKKIQPKFFIMENVRGMLSVAEQVVEDFNAIGYTVHYEVLKAEDFGVPQHRERLIYIGNRMGIDNKKIFDELNAFSEKLPRRTLKDALEGLRPLQPFRIKNATEKDTEESGRKIDRNTDLHPNEYVRLLNDNKVFPVTLNHKARYNNDRDIEIYSRLNQGDRSDDPKIADIMPYKRRNDIFKDKYFKLENDKVCKTITAHMKFDCNMYIHPTQPRGLTPREAARVQSYPDDYFFRGAYTKTYMQIGNAVPPLLGRALAHVIKKYLK